MRRSALSSFFFAAVFFPSASWSAPVTLNGPVVEAPAGIAPGLGGAGASLAPSGSDPAMPALSGEAPGNSVLSLPIPALPAPAGPGELSRPAASVSAALSLAPQPFAPALEGEPPRLLSPHQPSRGQSPDQEGPVPPAPAGAPDAKGSLEALAGGTAPDAGRGPALTSFFDRGAAPSRAPVDAFIDDFLAGVRDVSLRDGHQSLDGNRWLISERKPIAEKLDLLGLHSVESGGGADFDVATILGENPFENLRQFGPAFARTAQQWLFRGRNALGLGPQPHDVIGAMVEHAARNGLQRIRVFDGMNDVDNVRSTIKAARKAGVIVEGAVAYTVDPRAVPAGEKAWSVGAFVEMARAMRDMGAQAIAVKDMAGLLTEEAVVELVERLHSEVGLPISVHSHASTGRATGVLLKALETAKRIGARLVIDTAIGDLSGGTSHPDLREVLRLSLERAGYLPEEYGGNGKLRLLDEIAALIARTAERFKAGRIQVDAEMSALLDASGIPGGMVGTTAKMIGPGELRDFRRRLNRPELTVNDIIKEGLRRVPKVREDAGLPPLVTPMSQFVLMQAIFNFVDGDYVRIHPQLSAMMKGRFGRVRGPLNKPLLERLLKRDLLQELRRQVEGGNVAPALAAEVGGLDSLPLAEARGAIERALGGRVPAEALRTVLYAGEVGPPAPLPDRLPALIEEVRNLAFRWALNIPDPVEAALLLVAKEGRALLKPKAWAKVVGVRADGFPIAEAFQSRSEIEQALGDLPRYIALDRRNGRDPAWAFDEAARRLAALKLSPRASVAAELILEDLIDEEKASLARSRRPR